MHRRAPALGVLLALLVALVAGCGGSAHDAGRAPTRTTRTTRAPRRTTTTPAPTTTSTTTTVPPTTAPATVPPSTAARPPATTAAPAPPLVTRLNGVGDAGQVIAVDASGYGANSATLSAFQRTATGWQRVFGPWPAHVGRNGFAPPGAKREGDGRTPTGAYGFSFFFGVRANPGVRFPYRAIPGPWIVWDDDPASSNYNLWVDNRTQSAGNRPEPMDNPPVYDYGAVIAYNTERTPGLGSAIFFHVSSGGPTAGCVSLPESDLVAVLRWLDPARSPRIIMGTDAAITN